MAPTLERRPFGWERRATIAGTTSHPLISGTPIVFNQRSLDLGGFVEVIRPEAIQRTFNEKIDLRAFIDHDPGKVLGRLTAGTMRAEATAEGLHVEIDPPNRTDAHDLIESIRRGDISGMSFGFQTMGDDWKMENGVPVRYVTDMRVHEVSVVSMPAYEPTHVEIAQRAYLAFRETVAPTLNQYRARLVNQAAVFDAERRRYTASRIETRTVPTDVSRELADPETAWSAPSLADFTSKSWDSLTDAEKRKIAGHFAWADEMPPDAFGALHLPHHRASDGYVVWKGVVAAAARLNQVDGIDVEAARRHLESHYRQYSMKAPWQKD